MLFFPDRNYIYAIELITRAILTYKSSGGLLHHVLQSRTQLAGSGVVARISENFPRHRERSAKLTFLTINEFPRSPRPN